MIDYPGPGLDTGAAQVGLQVGSLLYRGGLGQGDYHHLGLFRILQLHHGGGEVHPLAPHLAGNFPVIGTGRIEQQQGVAGRRRIHHHEALARLANDPREGLKHGDLFGTGGTQIFFQQSAPLGIQTRPLGGQHLSPVTLGLGVGIDTADLQAGQGASQGLSQMGCGI